MSYNISVDVIHKIKKVTTHVYDHLPKQFQQHSLIFKDGKTTRDAITRYHVIGIKTCRQTESTSNNTKDRKIVKSKKTLDKNKKKEEEEKAMKGKWEEDIIVVPKFILCILQNRMYDGIYYTFLMTHSLIGKKTDTNIGYSTNPIYDIYLHNNQLINDRTTNAAAPFWVLDMVLGPFTSFNKAFVCSKEWVSGTRGKVSKRKKAHFLNNDYDVNLYSSEIRPKKPFLEYLKDIAHHSYIDTYLSLTGKK